MITEKQRLKRLKHIGASDVAAIMGLDPWRGAKDVWLEKTGRLEPAPPNPAMIRGNYLERAILDWAQDELKVKLRRNVYRSVKLAQGTKPYVTVGANLDAVYKDEWGGLIIVEAKSIGAHSGETWGEPGTDEVPDRVLLQCQAQMIASGAGDCIIAAYHGGRDTFVTYHLKWNEKIATEIYEACVDFWRDYVLTDTEPPQGEYSERTAPLIRRQTMDKIEPIADELVKAWQEAKFDCALASDHEKEVRQKLLTALKDKQVGECSLGLVTYFEQTRGAYNVPEAKYRVLRFKKIRKDKDSGE